MKINEVETVLGIPKATIRFYEKEGLMNPKRNANSYREYTDADIDRLKRIMVLRKIGVPVEDVKHLLNHARSLQDVLAENVQNIHEQISELNGALKVCEKMQKNEEVMDAFDQNYYWDIIQAEEARGQSFFDIAKDYLQFEKGLLDDVTGGGSKGIAGIAGCLLFASIVRGVVSYFTGSGFWNGFFGAFVVLAVVSIIFVPAFVLRKKENAKEKYVKWIGRIAAVFLLLVLLGVVTLLINAKLHFLF